MNRDKLIRDLRRYARRHGLDLQVDRQLGKGSHYRVKLGGRVSTLLADLNPGRIERFLKQLGLTSRDL